MPWKTDAVSVLKKYIAEGEHLRQDFKHSITGTSKIARTLAAFANSKGGRLLVGIKDNGKVVGVDHREEIHMLEVAAHELCKPPVHIAFTHLDEEGKTVLVAEIPESMSKPHYAPDDHGLMCVYVRQSDKTTKAGKITREVLKMQAGNKGAKIKYGEAERRLFALLSEAREGLTLKEFMKKSNTPYYKALRISANLVGAGLLSIAYTDTGERLFALSDKEFAV